MIIFLLLHFLPIVILSVIISRLIFRKSGKKRRSAGMLPLFFFITALFIFRPFIIAMWMLSIPLFGIFHLVLMAASALKKKNWPARIDFFVKLYILALPVYIISAIIVFSVSIGDNCGRLDKDPHLKPVFSLCDKKNVELAGRRFTNNLYHCRNAFFSADRSMAYIGFGAETNRKMQTLVAVDLRTHEIKREIPTNTVFRGYCNREFKTCVHLVTPRNTIRLWDDEKNEKIEDFALGRDRPRFLSVDVDDPRIVYVATDGEDIVAVNLQTRRIERKLKFPTSALTVVDNTRKHIVATTAMPFRGSLMVGDKKTGKVRNAPAGLWTVWKNFGYFFHVGTDPERERGFVVAPLECALYVVDLEKLKTTGRIVLPIGIRDISYDPKRNMVLASNFVNGYVYKIDVSGKKPKRAGRFFAGRRLRYFNYEPDEDVYFAASAKGFYIYDPEPGGRPAAGGKSLGEASRE